MATKLTKKEKGLADDFIETGNATLAAKNNYNVANDNTAASVASQVLKKAKVQQYIEDHAEIAATEVMRIVQFGESDQVRLSASKDVLDRAGHKPIEKSLNVQVSRKMDDEELQKTANELLRLQRENT